MCHPHTLVLGDGDAMLVGQTADGSGHPTSVPSTTLGDGAGIHDLDPVAEERIYAGADLAFERCHSSQV